MKTKIKTVDVQAYEWFDRVNANSYFAGTVTINFGMKSEKTFTMPFQYGYGDQYRYEALKVLQQNGFLKECRFPSQYRDFMIIARHNIQTGCKQKQLKQF